MAEQTQEKTRASRGLMSTTWENLSEQGSYVEEQTGDLFRIPEEALLRGHSPVISKVSKSERRLVRIGDSDLPIVKARMTAADLDIQPNF